MNLYRTMADWLGQRLLAVAVVLAAAPAAWAAGNATAPAWTQSPSCSLYVGLTNRLAGCLRDTIDAGAQHFFTEFYPMVQTAIGGVMTLAIIIYGVMLAYGMVERVGRDTMLLLIKVAAVVAFSSNSPLIYSTVIQGMDSAAAAAVSYVPPSGKADNAGSDFGQNGCMQNMVEQQAQSDQAKPVTGPWLGIDCLLDTVIGIKTSNGAGGIVTGATWYKKQFDAKTADKPENVAMSRGLLYLFFSGVTSSVFGIIMAAIGFIFIAGLLMVVVKAFFTYIAGYMGVALLIIISPMMIPLVLFNTATRAYFDKWVKLVISFALQPVIMLVFITFSLAAIDFAAFSGSYSIAYRIAGEASRAPTFDLNDYLTAKRDTSGNRDTASTPAADSKAVVEKNPRTVVQVKGDNDNPLPKQSTDVGGVMGYLLKTKCSPAAIKADTTGTLAKGCGFTQPIVVRFDTIDWDMMALARAAEGGLPVALEDGSKTPGQQMSREVLSAILFCAVVVFVMNGLLTIVPMVAHDLLGDAHQSPDIATSMAGKMGSAGGMMGAIGSPIMGAAKKK